jgi:pimeloyl-ACP methyl ester carboxylesterase
VQEREFQVYGRKLVALVHGEEGQPPLLALHGWLDNAESFSPLAPALSGFQLVALDLAGHGHSDHRNADGEYNIWSDLPDILAVVEELGWSSFSLLGHSRGAIIASLFASAQPERVSQLILLDAFTPQGVEPEDCPRQLGAYMKDKQRLMDKQSRIFATQEEAIKLRASKGIGPSAAELIVRRNLKGCEGGWQWSTDARLQGASAFKLTPAHNTAIMSALDMPTLILLAEQGLASRLGIESQATGAARIERVPGGHHCHMEESVEVVAQYIRSFTDTEDSD